MMADFITKPQIQMHKTWRNALSASEKVLTFAAIWPSKEKGFFREVRIILSILLTMACDLLNVVESRNLMLQQDYDVLSTHLSTCGLYVGYFIKIIIFYLKKNSFEKVLAAMESPMFDDYSTELQKYKDKCISVADGIATYYIYTVAASCFLYLNKPLYTNSNLPMSFSYDLNLVTYILVLVWQCFSCYYLVMGGVCLDMTAIGLMNIATFQMDILIETITSFNPKNFSEKEQFRFLRKCVKRHQAIIRFVAEMENVFNLIFLTQCLASIIGICNGAFQLNHTKDILSVYFIFNCAFAADILFEIGICCWFGNLLTLKSLQISDACFNFDWMNTPTSTKKMLLIIMSRSQKPLFVTVGKFTQLSIRSFLVVLKTAYSYFALMQSLYDKKNN